MLHYTIQRAINVLIDATTDGNRYVARGTDDLIIAAAEELCISRAKVEELEKECDDLTGENRTLSGKVEDLENVIEYMEHGNKLVEPRMKTP